MLKFKKVTQKKKSLVNMIQAILIFQELPCLQVTILKLTKLMV